MKQPKRRVARRTAEDWRQNSGVNPSRPGPGESRGGMRRGGHEREAGRTSVRQQALRPVHAIRRHAAGKPGIGGDQQNEPTAAADSGQAASGAGAVGRAKVPENHRCAARQLARHRNGIGRALGISEEKQCRDAGRSGIAVEPSGLRR